MSIAGGFLKGNSRAVAKKEELDGGGKGTGTASSGCFLKPGVVGDAEWFALSVCFQKGGRVMVCFQKRVKARSQRPTTGNGGPRQQDRQEFR